MDPMPIGPPPPVAPSPAQEFITNFGRSAVYGAGALVGIEAPPDLQAWEHKHPIASFAANMLPVGGYYGAAIKGGRALLEGRTALSGANLLGKLDEIGSGKVWGSIVRRGLGDVIAAAPAEAGRLAVTKALGNDVKEVGTDIAMGAAVAGALGGGVGLLEGAGRRVASKWMAGGGDASQPIQLQMREMLRKIDDGEIENVDRANAVIDQWKREIRSARPERVNIPEGGLSGSPKAKQSYLKNELDGEGDVEEVNSLFRLLGNKPTARTTSRPLFVAGEDATPAAGFRTEADLADVTTRAGLPANWEAYAQYPTHRVATAPKAANALAFNVSRNFDEIDRGWYMAKEKGEDGMYVLARKVAPRPLEGDAVGGAASDVGGMVPPAGGAPGKVVPGGVAGPKGDVFGASIGASKSMPSGTVSAIRTGTGDIAGPKGTPFRPQEWVFFKTDLPSVFTPRAGSLIKAVDVGNAFGRQIDRSLEDAVVNPLFHAVRDFNRDMPVTVYEQGSAKSLLAKGGKAFTNVLSKVYDFGDISGAREAIARVTDEYLAPAAYQFRRNPLAAKVHTIKSMAYDTARALGNTRLYGDIKLTEGKNGFVQLLGAPKPAVESPAALIDALDHKDLHDLSRVLYRQGGDIGKALDEFGTSDRVRNLVKTLDEFDTKDVEHIQSLERLLGKNKFIPLKDHLGISRSWKGSHRVPVFDGDAVVALGSGESRKLAQDEAEFIAQRGRESGRNWQADLSYKFKHDTKDDFDFLRGMTRSKEALRMAGAFRDEFHARAPQTPKTFKRRSGMGGATGEYAAFTKKDLLDTLNRHTQQNLKYQAQLSTDHVLFNDLARLRREDRSVYEQLLQRENDRLGIQGPLSTALNKGADAFLGDFIGKNSISKIVQSLNSSLHHLSFGFINLAFPVINALQFVQTVVPELYFIRGGVGERLSPYYTHFMRAGPDGLPRELLATLSPVKIVCKALGKLGRPDAELLDALGKARNMGVIDSRIFDEVVGTESHLSHDFRNTVSKAGNFLGVLGKLNTILPETAERLSRAHTFTSGWVVARDVLGLGPDEAFQFARQFTNRTMYGYGVADRSRVFTGPFGSAIGLFKNWQMHYIYQMMDYAGLGLAHGQWAPLLAGMAGTVGLGGVAAAGPLYFAANSLARDVFGKRLDELWYSQWPRDDNEPNVSDAVFMGIPGFLGSLVGLPIGSMTSSVAAPGSDPQRDMQMLMGFVYADRMKHLGQAVGAAFEAADATGQNPLRDSRVVSELTRALAPRTLSRLIQQTGEGAIRSASSLYPQIDGLSKMEQAFYVAGFNPHKVQLAFQTNDRVFQEQADSKALVSSIGRAMADAKASGDFGAMQKLQTRATALGVDLDRVMRSMRAVESKMQKSQFERQASEQQKAVQRGYGVAPQPNPF